MAEIEWHDLTSSNMSAVAYDPNSGEVLIRFASGATYAYPGDEDDVQGVINDPSAAKGHYFSRHLRDRSYRRI